MKIAHFSAEVSPFAKTGGLGDVVGALPIAQAELGHNVAVWMPLYRQAREEIKRRGMALEKVADPLLINVGYQRHAVGVSRSWLPGSSVPVYFVSNDRFFDRPFIYYVDEHGRDDGLFRFAVFVRGALEAAKQLNLIPDVFHAHDWHAALVPMALAWDRPAEPRFRHAVSIYTIHNLAFQGIYDRGEFPYLGLPRDMLAATRWHDPINLMKGAVLSCNAVNAVSPSFAREMTTEDGGFGLDAIFRYRGDNLVGIVNGIDTKVWNPAIDSRIASNYTREDISLKAKNRQVLLERAGMDAGDPGLVVGMVGRLTEQKGYDLFFDTLDYLLRDGIRFVLLGAGEAAYESMMGEYSSKASSRFFGHVGFDDSLAHLIEAGSDAFLMPSRFEPCGLSQLYSLAYGTPPVVRRVGGLKDTVIPFNGKNLQHANGFGFEGSTPQVLRAALHQVDHCFHSPDIWQQIVRNGMDQDFSWEHSAQTYIDLYRWQLEKLKARSLLGAGRDTLYS